MCAMVVFNKKEAVPEKNFISFRDETCALQQLRDFSKVAIFFHFPFQDYSTVNLQNLILQGGKM